MPAPTLMIIHTWGSRNRDEVLNSRNRWFEKNSLFSQIVQEWTDIGGGRTFILFDPSAISKASKSNVKNQPPGEKEEQEPPWTFLYDLNHLGEVEVIPVIETGKLIHQLKKFRKAIFNKKVSSRKAK